MSGTGLEGLFAALLRAVDEEKLKRELAKWVGAGAPFTAAPPSAPTATPEAAPAAPSGPDPRLLLQDVLDDSILGAKAGDKSYPLRLLLAALASSAEESAFTLLCALNTFFRVEADDEVKLRLGVEVSRLYYRFMEEAHPEGLAAAQASGLVAALLTTQLERVRLETVDHAGTFDSVLHERAPGSDAGSHVVLRAGSFACRVQQTGNVRIKALVYT